MSVMPRVSSGERYAGAPDLESRSNLLSIFAQVPEQGRSPSGYPVAIPGAHGWVEPCRGMDIKAGIGRQAQIPDDALEVLAIIVRKERV